MRSAIWTCGLVLLLAGCAQGGDGLNPRGGDSGGGSGIDAQVVPTRDAAVPLDCDPACVSGEVCRDGACVPGELDEDGDGVPAAIDCNDMDPAITTSAERECSNECGVGVERCTDGVWSACDAPSSCECPLGAPPRTVDCVQCGSQRQICVDGTWTNDGACMDMGACAPGATDSASQSCGTCGGGTQQRTRSCGTDCTWGAWSNWGSCTGDTGGACTPGQEQTERGDCGNCGSRTRKRTCTSGCTWGAWGSWGTCSGQGVCAPGATRTGCDRNSAGTPTTCGVQRCNSSCSWNTACELAPGAACLSGQGSNYGCCTAPGGGSGWRFCNASTCQWYACEAHSC